MNKKIALAILAMLIAGSASATNATGNFQSTASLSSTCKVSTGNIAFGNFSPADSSHYAVVNSSITSICTKATSYTMVMSAGNSGTSAFRSMKGNNVSNHDMLQYNVYLTTGPIFGDGNNGTSTVVLSGTGANQTTNIFGYVNFNQYITPDTYTDNLSITLTY